MDSNLIARLGGDTAGASEGEMTKLGSFLSDDAGASAAEYALILAVICTAIVASLMFLKHAIASATKYTANEIPPR